MSNHKRFDYDQQRSTSIRQLDDRVLLYTVVLNLFVEYSDAIVIDSFTISVLTAIVLKALLDVIDIIFREHVEIGGFIPLLVLIITMLVAELILQRIYDRLGRVKQSGLEATQSISDDHSQPRFAKCRYDLPRLRRS